MKISKDHIPELRLIDIRSMLRLNPFFSLGGIFIEWLIIIAAVYLHLRFSNAWVYIFSCVLIGSRMYALYALLHDGIHYLLFPSKKVNDIISTVFLAVPLFISLPQIRKLHFAHHLNLKTSDDPEYAHLQYSEFQFPKPILSIIGVFILDIIGFNFIYYKIKKAIRLIIKVKYGKDIYPFVFSLIKIAAIFFILLITNLWLEFFIYWVVPYITIYQFLNRLRLSAEHITVDEYSLFQTRTIKSNFIERFLLSPNGIGFHTEHHLFPAVPFYRLPQLHNKLMNVQAYKENLKLDRSYWHVFKYFIRKQ